MIGRGSLSCALVVLAWTGQLAAQIRSPVPKAESATIATSNNKQAASAKAPAQKAGTNSPRENQGAALPPAVIPQRRGAPKDIPYTDDMTWGYRNPGNVGRRAEYYPPGNRFQNEGAGPHVAYYDQGPAATQRYAQLQSEMVGIGRYRSVQSGINVYGRPLGFGFPVYGFGFGFRNRIR
jgi:hypothetical protein